MACRTQTDTVSRYFHDLALDPLHLHAERLNTPSAYSKYHRPDYPRKPGTTTRTDGNHLLALDVISSFDLYCNFNPLVVAIYIQLLFLLRSHVISGMTQCKSRLVKSKVGYYNDLSYSTA